MVGRGWWLLVLTVCVAWMVCCVCGGSFCQQGQEFYNSQDGQCVPCTRCHDPLVVVVPCYVFQDAVCAPAINFLPNLSQHTGPQAPITLSTPTSLHNDATREAHPQERRTPHFPTDNHKLLSNAKKDYGNQQGKNKSIFSNNNNNNKHGNISNGNSKLSDSDFEQNRKGHSKHHHHRHKHLGGHSNHRTRNKSLVSAALDPEVNGDNVSQKNGANKSFFGLSGSGDKDSGLIHVNISDGANSDKDLNSDLGEPETSHWQNYFFLMTVIIISVIVIVLIFVILSQLRSIFIRRKLKSVCDAVPTESSSEVTVMAQLIPAAVNTTRSLSTFSNTRNTVSDTTQCTISRSTFNAASIPSSPTTTSRGQIVLESQHITGQMYPPIPFTMDRLLERRRVLGPSTSVDTNLYIESWQQVDSQSPTQRTPSASSVLTTRPTRPFESVSACPSPVPLRTYRLGPASASTSPIVPVRGLGSRVPMRGLLATPTYILSSSSRDVVLNSRT